MSGTEDHYFTAEPASADERRRLTVRLVDREVAVQTAPGVFSGSRLDPGTQVLLRSVPAPPAEGDLLDLGCGWGPVALSLAMLSPGARVWAVDVNRRALDLVARNAAELGLDGIRTAEPDGVPADLRFATIWSNPPIRIGKPALHALLDDWLPRLAPGGAAWLVVQKSLGADSLQGWIEQELGMPVNRVASSKGFRVLRVTRD
ncbi:class I SAM-dependent methyltransferase [Actinotalea sp.]|uniref:class I SAM-dependent methyltransferase n=1 Tax=Actinotalea sp. TaxID=1872145 RepID=UPI00356A8CE2